MYSGGAACYCSYFNMPAGDRYRISVRIRRPDDPRVHEVEFVQSIE
jgi:hypothetical protein